MGKEENPEVNVEDTDLITEEENNKKGKSNLIEDEQVDVDLEEDIRKLNEKIIEIPESEYLTLKKEKNTYKKLVDENLNKLKSVQADFENYKKILQRDKEDYCKYAEQRILLQLLNIIDDFEITLNGIRKEIKDKEKLKGLEIISKKIFELLDKEEVKPVKSVGEIFDPFIHEVLCSEVTDEYPENTIVEEFKRGYYLKDKILRPALVKIAKNE